MIRRLIDAFQNWIIFLAASPGNRRELAAWAEEVTDHARQQADALTIGNAARDRIRAALTDGDRDGAA